MSIVDRKGSNGKGTNRIETGGGDLSTTVQMGKATASYSNLIKGEFTDKGQVVDHGHVDLYSEHNVQELRSDAKALRHQNPNLPKGTSPQPGSTSTPTGGTNPKIPIKGKAPITKRPQTKSDHAQFLAEKSERYRGGGEKLS